MNMKMSEPSPAEQAANAFSFENQKEAAEYLASQGIIPIEERMLPFIQSLSGESKERYSLIEEHIAPLEEGLKQSETVFRLRRLYQLNGKTVFGHEGDHMMYLKPPFHSRFDHSELIAAYIKFVGARIGLAAQELKPAVAAAWMHDTGHSAFSHLGDELLIERGRVEHEERSLLHLGDTDIVATFEKQNMSKEEVAGYLREEGALGALESVCDTLSYLTFDTKVFGKDGMGDEGLALLSDIKGIDREKNMLVVEKPELWQAFIETRARMYKNLYYHPVNKRADEAMRQLLRIALNRNLITLDDIENGTDMELRLTLQSLVQRDAGAQRFSISDETEPVLEEYKDLYTLSLGFDAEGWGRQTFDTEEQAIKALHALPVKAIEQSFMSKPFDYTKKKVTLLKEENGQLLPFTISAKEIEIRDEDRKFVVHFPVK